MNKIKLNFTLLVVVLCMAMAVNAQPWMRGIANQENPNFFEIQKSFNDYWAAKGIDPAKANKGKEEEAGMESYAQYKRWEWYMSRRVNAAGEFPDPMIAYNESKKFQEQANHRMKSINSITASWVPLGPSPVPSGGGAGRLNCITINPLKTTTIYVGAPDGGVWKSNNGGTSWNTTTDLLSSLGVTDIVIDPNDTSHIYIATGDGDGRDSYSTGIMESHDGGATWATTGLNWTTSQTRYFGRLIMDPTNSLVLFAASKVGIYKSIDGGVTWTNPLASTRIYDLQFKPNNHNIIYAGGDSVIYRSTDNGATFTSVYSTTGTDRINMAVTPVDTNYVYAILSNSSADQLKAVLRSTNGGTSFTSMATTPNILGWSNGTGGDAGSGQGWYDLSIVASPTVSGTLFIGGVNVWTSTNGGTSWTKKTSWTAANSTYVHADIHRLAFLPGSSTTLFACCDGGIFKSTNSGTAWTDLSTGLSIMEFYSISNAQTSSTIVQGGAQDNGTNLYSAGTWTQDLGGDGMTSIVDYFTSNTMYGEQYNGTINRTTNGGGSWTGITPNGQSGAWVTPYIIDPNTHTTIYAGWNDVYKSTNQGTSWTQISTTLTGNAGDFVMAMACAPSNSNYLYIGAGGNNGIISTSTFLFKTTNGGTSWTDVTGTLPLSTASLTAIAIKASDPLTVWVTLTGYTAGTKVYKTTNGGTTWTNISGNLPNVPVNCITFDKTVSTDRIFVGTDVGVFYTDNTLAGQWLDFNTGLPNVLVYSLDVQVSAGLLRAGTFGRGLWETSLSIFTGNNDHTLASNGVKVYPNPTNGEVSVYLPTTGTANISIFNAIGEKVYAETLEAKGNTTHKIDLSRQAKGIYFIRIATADGISNEKLVLTN